MDFQISRARDLDRDLGSGHAAYHRASLIHLCLHAKVHWNRRNVWWTDERTDGRIFETHVIRSTQKSRPKNGRLASPASNPWIIV